MSINTDTHTGASFSLGNRLARVSQPLVPGNNPERAAIATSLSLHGFTRISEDAYLHRETEILLTDAAPRNVRIVDGRPVPFDAIAMLATDAVVEWALSRGR